MESKPDTITSSVVIAATHTSRGCTPRSVRSPGSCHRTTPIAQCHNTSIGLTEHEFDISVARGTQDVIAFKNQLCVVIALFFTYRSDRHEHTSVVVQHRSDHRIWTPPRLQTPRCRASKYDCLRIFGLIDDAAIVNHTQDIDDLHQDKPHTEANRESQVISSS